MLSLRKHRWLKIIAAALILAFIPAQSSWAGRGRRGGNSSGDIIVAAIGGAATPLSCYFFGANPTTLLVTSGTRFALVKAGCDPQTTMLVTAAVGGMTGSALSGEKLFSDVMLKQIVKRIVAAEVTYELSRSEGSRWYAGMVGSMAGYMTGMGIEGAYGNKEGFDSYAEQLPESAVRIAVSGGISSLIRYKLLPQLLGKNSLALNLYGQDVASLGGSLAIEATEEFGVLPERTTYRVTTIYNKPAEADFSYDLEETRKATPEEITEFQRYGKQEKDGTSTVYSLENGATVVKRVLDKKGDIHFRKSTSLTKELKGWEERGYECMANPKTGQVLVLDRYDPRPRFVGQDQGPFVKVLRDDKSNRVSKNNKGNFVDNKGNLVDKNKVTDVARRYMKPESGKGATVSYENVPFSDEIKNIRISRDGVSAYRYQETEMPRHKLELKQTSGVQREEFLPKRTFWQKIIPSLGKGITE